MATTAAAARVVPAQGLARPSRSLWDNAFYKLRRDKLTIAATCVLVVLAALSAAAPLFSDYVFHFKFEQQDLLHTYEKPTLAVPAYLLGSDEIGRSQVVRLLYGGRISLLVGFVAASQPATSADRSMTRSPGSSPR
jgi:ABC-type dipeptide/oligopeptide/nickel transport system permease subunit